MDEEDRSDTIEILKQADEWVIWKTKDKWSVFLTVSGFHQLLYRKTSKGNVGDQRSKDGGEQETFGSKSQKRFWNVG